MILLYHPPFSFYLALHFCFPFLNFNAGTWISWSCIFQVNCYFVPSLLSIIKLPKWFDPMLWEKLWCDFLKVYIKLEPLRHVWLSASGPGFWHGHILPSFHASFYLGLACHHSVWIARRQRQYIRCFR